MSSFFSLADEKKKIIWVINLWIGDVELCFTGFAITDAGHIMTTAHRLNHGNLNSVITARRLDQETFSVAQVVMIRQNWNLAILKVNKKTPYGEFASNGNLAPEQPLLYMGNPDPSVGISLFGNVAFQCVDKVIIPADGQVCKVFRPNERKKTPPYRVMGHVYNRDYFKREVKNRSRYTKEFIMNLHPLIPIIQTYGFCLENEFDGWFGGCGLEGGPMFDSNGQIVGMIFTDEDDCQLGIHVSLLRHSMQLCQLCPNMV